jgi:thiol-disulfide isomerase/thioredoxin
MRCACLVLLAVPIAAYGQAPEARVVAVAATGHRVLAPEVAVGPRGEVAVIWLDAASAPVEAAAAAAAAGAAGAAAARHDRHDSAMDLWFARSTDGGASFGPAVRINSEAGTVWGFAVSKPKIAIGRAGTIHVVFPASSRDPRTGKTALVMAYARSADGGRHFAPQRLLHRMLDIDQSAFMDGGFTIAHAFGTVGVAPDGSVHAVWVDTRDMQATHGSAAAWTAVSRNDGRSFGPETVALADGVCPCCQLSIAFDAQSRLYLGSRRVTDDGHRNSSVAHAHDAHATRLQAPVQTSLAPWLLEGCPLKPTVVGIVGNDVFTAAYDGAETPAGVYLSVSRDQGATFGAARALHAEATVSDAPALAASAHGVFVAWHAKVGAGTRTVYWRHIDAQSLAMGPVTQVDETAGAGAPVGAAQSPALAARPDGRVQLVWQRGGDIATTVLDAAPVAAGPIAARAAASAAAPLVSGATAPAPASAPAPAPAPAIVAVDPARLRAELVARQGDVVLLSVWATWCVPCLREIPELVALEQEYSPRGLRLFGLSMDEPGAMAGGVEPFRREHFPQFSSWARGDSDMDQLVSVVDPAWNEILPTTYLIGRDGKVAARLQGRRTPAELRALIESALGT